MQKKTQDNAKPRPTKDTNTRDDPHGSTASGSSVPTVEDSNSSRTSESQPKPTATSSLLKTPKWEPKLDVDQSLSRSSIWRWIQPAGDQASPRIPRPPRQPTPTRDDQGVQEILEQESTKVVDRDLPRTSGWRKTQISNDNGPSAIVKWEPKSPVADPSRQRPIRVVTEQNLHYLLNLPRWRPIPDFEDQNLPRAPRWQPIHTGDYRGLPESSSWQPIPRMNESLLGTANWQIISTRNYRSLLMPSQRQPILRMDLPRTRWRIDDNLLLASRYQLIPTGESFPKPRWQPIPITVDSQALASVPRWQPGDYISLPNPSGLQPMPTMDDQVKSNAPSWRPISTGVLPRTRPQNYVIGPAPGPCLVCRYRSNQPSSIYLQHCIPQCPAIIVNKKVVFETSDYIRHNDVRPSVVHLPANGVLSKYGEARVTSEFVTGRFTLPNSEEEFSEMPGMQYGFQVQDNESNYPRSYISNDPFKDIYDVFVNYATPPIELDQRFQRIPRNRRLSYSSSSSSW